jgi:hypothetical protein
VSRRGDRPSAPYASGILLGVTEGQEGPGPLSSGDLLGLSSSPARSNGRRCAQAGSIFISRLPCCTCWTCRRIIGEHLVG